METLNYAPRVEFDAGLFVARYLRVLGWLSIASMGVAPIAFQTFRIDLTFIFLFWAASSLKRHSATARKWVLGIVGTVLGLLLAMLTWGTVMGTAGMTVSLGYGEIRNPSLPQLFVGAVPALVVLGIPFGVLMSRRAREQFRRPRCA